jgi:GNAT superfamily N-acetyltransferase
MAPDTSQAVVVRNTRPDDIENVLALAQRVYGAPVWRAEQIESHLRIFPAGQLVAELRAPDQPPGAGEIVGMAASLIVRWDDYDFDTPWRDFTDHGYFTNHDPERGKTLYGAEVMVDPNHQGHGVGKKIYAARREVCRTFRLARIRAGARIPHYCKYQDRMTADEYVDRVVAGELGDPTLSFQLKQGFSVLAVTPKYLPSDSSSGGYAVVIEWLNREVPQPQPHPPLTGRYHRDIASPAPSDPPTAAAAPGDTADGPTRPL